MRPSAEKGKIALVLLVSIVTFFVNNNVITPDIMESRNIITAREMVYDGHWIIPTMNGELRLEKPPLPTWLAAVAEIVSPDNIALQRGMAGLAAVLLVFYFYYFAKHILKIEPLIPTLLLCTCYNVILMGRTASWDIYCHAFMLAGIYHLSRALLSPPRAWRHFIAAGIFTGLSILSKGPVSLYALFLPFLISFGLFYHPSTKKKGFAVITFIIVALVVGAWWYAYVYLFQDNALTAVVKKESGSWIDHNVRPWWYYWKFFLEAGVWSFLLLTAIFLPLFNRLRRSSRQWLFTLCWMLLSLVLLSLLPEKKSRYLLPLIIPATYLMGSLVTWWRESLRYRSSVPRADKWWFRINTLLIAATVVILPLATWKFFFVPGYIPLWALIAFTVFVILIVVYLIYVMVNLRPMGLLGSVTILFLAAECLVMPTLKNIINNPEMKSISETREIKALDGVPFYHIDNVPLRIELVYAAHRNISPICIDSIDSKLPCVLLTHKPIDKTLTEKSLGKIEATLIDKYDDNRRPKTSRRYSDEFIYYATLLNVKADTATIINEENINMIEP
ncbi:MAG: glycosyltransferase family 39 protein [Prevotella sp.]|nr:glycosyltransferase family 39 protein [Prevotella sp.]